MTRLEGNSGGAVGGVEDRDSGDSGDLGAENRNLQAAIGAYYDFESPNISVPSMSFVEDVTIGEGESIPPDTQFIKTWRIQNSGAEAWPPGVCLKYVGGDQFGHVNMVMVRSLEPQEIADVSVQMCSPSRAGMYQGQWRMCTATGLYYGDVIWVILSVEVGGLLGVTQQLSSFETEFNTQPHRKVEGNFNPFASPQKSRQSDENNLKDPGGSEFDSISKNTWAPAPDQTEQDQNRLSQNSVNLSPSSHANNLSVVTYSKLSAIAWKSSRKSTQVLGPLHPRGRLGRHSWFLALDQLSSGHCGHLGSEPADGRPFSLCLSVTLPFK
ncbi:protein ILRUN isoform X2 [Oryctolagus cuniculus]|uniref:protein ILRUN isoform X2 n=1 Tax=Oryctolagus cuniculus TaxID=9986 RepID=UPI003879E734